MLTLKDQERLSGLYELDRHGVLENYVIEVVGELREQGLGRLRDPRELPFLKSALRVYEQLYQPPTVPAPAEVIHVLFPGLRAEIADRVLARMIRELPAMKASRN